MTQDEAREIANQFGSRMCDENGETHGEELYCFDLDGLIAIKEALAQPEQEPHGWYIDGYGAVIGTAEPKSVRVGEWLPWYTHPPQRKPLTEQEIGAILEDINAFGTRLYTFARAIEAAHGIKENT